MCATMPDLSKIKTQNVIHFSPINDDHDIKAKFAGSVRRVTQQDVNKEHLAKRRVFSRQDIQPTSTIKLQPRSTNLIRSTCPKDGSSVMSHPNQQRPDNPNNAHFRTENQLQGESLATSRLDLLAQNSKTNRIGEFIGRIFAHAVIDSINDESLNITGIDNKLLKTLAEYALVGKINPLPGSKDGFYQSLSRRKRFVYRKTYQKIKTCLSQTPSSDEPIKGWKSKRLHKVTAGIKNSILDQPELNNIHLKEIVSSKFNQKADSFVKNSSSHIDKDFGKSKRHKLGYAITAGFIAVLRERAPGAIQRVSLVNTICDLGVAVTDIPDAITTVKDTVTLAKLNDAFTHSFGDQVDGIANMLSATTKAVSDATSDVTFEKFSTAFKNFFWGNQ